MYFSEKQILEAVEHFQSITERVDDRRQVEALGMIANTDNLILNYLQKVAFVADPDAVQELKKQMHRTERVT